MIMLKIWMLLPVIHAMKHMTAMFLRGAVALEYKACCFLASMPESFFRVDEDEDTSSLEMRSS